jgi:hypothetical protein
VLKQLVITAMASIVCGAAPQAVLVELFTSEGCSSCPAADALLEEIDRTQPLAGIRVIVLSEHVDYWNHIGWKDPFSSPAFSRRQEQYARRLHLPSIYTPQLVVDGKSEMVGSDEHSVRQAILNAAKDHKVPMRVQTLSTGVRIDIDAAATDDAVLILASADSSTTVSNVKQGENSGRLLKHVAVVRSLKEIGVVRKGKPFATTVPVEEGTGNKRWIAFLQERGQGRVIGVASSFITEAK